MRGCSHQVWTFEITGRKEAKKSDSKNETRISEEISIERSWIVLAERWNLRDDLIPRSTIAVDRGRKTGILTTEIVSNGAKFSEAQD